MLSDGTDPKSMESKLL